MNNSKGYEIEINNLKFSPPKGNSKGILRNISLNIKSGQFVTFIGRNGHGKSSIFNAISGELKYVTGTVKVGNTIINSSIHKLMEGVGIVHQYVQDDLIKEYSILKNIQIRQLFSVDSKIRQDANKNDWVPKINARLADFITSADFKPTNDTLVDELSGGQRQLLNVLIALEFEHSSNIGCRLLMLDEHLTSLDVIIQRKVMNLITKIVSDMKFKPTILMITHDFQYALEFSDEICIVKEGEIKEVILKNNKNKWKMDYLITSIE